MNTAFVLPSTRVLPDVVATCATVQTCSPTTASTASPPYSPSSSGTTRGTSSGSGVTRDETELREQREGHLVA